MGKLAIVDYGCGNLFSLSNALEAIGADFVITKELSVLQAAERILLPGVGAFGEAMQKLTDTGLVEPLREMAAQKPFLGICVGAQLLFEYGHEFGLHRGLGLLPGEVRKIKAEGLKIPHMGWNDVQVCNPAAPSFVREADGKYFYFVHSFKIDAPDAVVYAAARYGETIPAVVGRDRVMGFQFHPEKSGEAGLQLLAGFVREAL